MTGAPAIPVTGAQLSLQSRCGGPHETDRNDLVSARSALFVARIKA
jgi:hypothetical protein